MGFATFLYNLLYKALGKNGLKAQSAAVNMAWAPASWPVHNLGVHVHTPHSWWLDPLSGASRKEWDEVKAIEGQCSVATWMGRKSKEEGIYIYVWLTHFAVQQKLT